MRRDYVRASILGLDFSCRCNDISNYISENIGKRTREAISFYAEYAELLKHFHKSISGTINITGGIAMVIESSIGRIEIHQATAIDVLSMRGPECHSNLCCTGAGQFTHGFK